MADRLMYIPNNDAQNNHFCRLQLIVETFGQSTSWTSQLKLNKNKNSKFPKFLRLVSA